MTDNLQVKVTPKDFKNVRLHTDLRRSVEATTVIQPMQLTSDVRAQPPTSNNGCG